MEKLKDSRTFKIFLRTASLMRRAASSQVSTSLSDITMWAGLTNLASLPASLQSPDLTGGKILETNVRKEEKEVTHVRDHVSAKIIIY